MPHGGVHILRKLAIRFEELGIEQTDEPQYPEAKDDIEAAMLQTLSIAKSPLAVELLLTQPQKLRECTPTQAIWTINCDSQSPHHSTERCVLLGAPKHW